METTAGVGRGAASLFAANIVSLVANTAYYVILTNVLHTVQVGIVTTLNIMIWFFVVVCCLAQPVVFGAPIPAPLAVLKFVPEFMAKNEQKTAAQVFKISLGVTIMIGFIVAAALTLLPPSLVTILGGQAILPIYLRLSAADMLVIAASQVCLGVIVALGGSYVASLYIMVWSLVRYVFASAFLVMFGIAGVLAGWVVGDFVVLLVTLRWAVSRLGGQGGSGDVSGKEIARYNAYTFLGALAGYAMNQADRLFALWQRGLSGVAVYNVALVGGGIVAYVPNVLVTVLVPALAALLVSNRTEQIHEMIRSYSRYVSLVVVPIGFGLAAILNVLLGIFGSAYVSGWSPGAIVSIATGLTAVGAVYAGVLIAIGKLRWYTAANLLGLAALLVVSAVLTPILGLNGPALGRSSLLVVVALIYVLAAYKNGVFYIDSHAYAIVMVCSSVMAAIVFGALLLIPGFVMKLVMLPVVVLLGLLLYVGLLRISRLLTVKDLSFLHDLLPRRLWFILPLTAKVTGLEYRPPETIM